MKWLSGITLSISQWAIGSLCAIIGLLLVALKLQGSRLHKAQVALLALHMAQETEREDGNVEAARTAFQASLKAYREAQ